MRGFLIPSDGGGNTRRGWVNTQVQLTETETWAIVEKPILRLTKPGQVLIRLLVNGEIQCRLRVHKQMVTANDVEVLEFTCF